VWERRAKMSRQPLNPLTKHGKVVFNGEVHNTLNTMAEKATRPYYAKANGVDADCYRQVSNGSIAFSIINADKAINTLIQSNFEHGAENNNRLLGVDCLNGLFDNETNHESIQHKIVVLGIVEQPGAGHLFNIIRQGVISVINNSDQTLNNGDETYGYAPTVEELPNGGYGTMADANGVAKLWFMPFKRDMHGVIPKPIYICLKAIEKKMAKSYLDSYKRLCMEFERGICETTLVTLAAVGYEKMNEIVTTAGSTAGMLTALHNILGRTNGRANDPELKERQREMLFVKYSENQQWIEPFTPNSLLNRMQSEASGRFLKAVTCFDQDCKKHIVGKVLTTALPGQPFSLQVNK
jgi:hypothetical protein